MKNNVIIVAIICSVCQLTGCGGGSDDGSDLGAKPSSSQVVSETKTLAEGVQLSYTLPAGNYTANITSSNNGVVVSWLGGSNCQTSSETKVYSASCALNAQGQIVITNPTTFGLGGSEITTIFISKNQ